MSFWSDLYKIRFLLHNLKKTQTKFSEQIFLDTQSYRHIRCWSYATIPDLFWPVRNLVSFKIHCTNCRRYRNLSSYGREKSVQNLWLEFFSWLQTWLIYLNIPYWTHIFIYFHNSTARHRISINTHEISLLFYSTKNVLFATLNLISMITHDLVN